MPSGRGTALVVALSLGTACATPRLTAGERPDVGCSGKYPTDHIGPVLLVGGTLAAAAGIALFATTKRCSGPDCYISFDPVQGLAGAVLIGGGGAGLIVGAIRTVREGRGARCEDVIEKYCTGTPAEACAAPLQRACKSGDRDACWALDPSVSESASTPASTDLGY